METIDARHLLQGLVGTTIRTLTGRPNTVIRLNGDDVIVGTIKSPRGEPVPLELVQNALDRLVSEREIDINVESVGYRSAFIGAVLATLPGAIATTHPRMIRVPRHSQ